MTTIKPPNNIQPTPSNTNLIIPPNNPSIQAFLKRNNLPPNTILEISQFFTSAHPHKPHHPVSTQGFCSLTFSLPPNLILQFRPQNYALDLSTTSLAANIHPRYAPRTQFVTTLPRSGLLVYEMSVMPGISLYDYRLESPSEAMSKEVVEELVRGFAGFWVEAWKLGGKARPEDYRSAKVASTLYPRLLTLHKHLPTRFRALTTRLLESFEEIVCLPWVLTHGDLLPGNIMVSSSKPREGKLISFVDWGESEYLPFGMGFYGLDEILALPCLGTEKRVRFHPDSRELRTLFWEELEKGGVSGALRGRMEMARQLGVLLWFGIAWDGGAIDRVVEEGTDEEEIGKLDGFLFGCGKGDFANEEVKRDGVGDLDVFERNRRGKEVDGVLPENGLNFVAKL